MTLPKGLLFRWPATGLACIVIAMSSGLIGAQRVAAAAVDLAVTAGFDSSAKPQPLGWTPVVATVTNHGAGEFDGMLELTPGPSQVVRAPDSTPIVYGARTTAMGPAGSATIERSPVVVAGGGSKAVTFWAASAKTYRITLRDRAGQQLAQDEVAVARTLGLDLMLGVVSEHPDALAALDGLRIGGQTIRVVRFSVGDLPENGVVLQGFAAMVFDGADGARIGDRQRQALADYLSQGGGVIVTARAPHVWGSSQADFLLPNLQVTGEAQLPAVPMLSSLLGKPEPAGPLQVARSELHDGGVAMVADGGVPLLVTARRGAGHVLFMAFDPDSPPLRDWSGQAPLMRQVVAEAAPPAVNGNGGTPRNPIENWQPQAIDQALIDARPFSPRPDPWLLWGALPIYFLVFGVAVNSVLKRMPEVRVPWVGVLVAMVLCAGVYWLGMGGLDRLPVQRIRIMHVDADTGRAYVEAAVGLTADSVGAHTVSSGGSTLVTDLAALTGNPQDLLFRTDPSPTPRTATVAGRLPGDPIQVTLIRQHEQGNQIVNIATEFGTESFGNLGGGLTENLVLGGQTVSGVVTSHLPFELHDAHVVVAGSVAGWVGSVRPGVATTVSFEAPDYGQIGFERDTGPTTAMLPLLDGGSSWSRVGWRRQQMLGALYPGRVQGLLRDPMLLGWAATGSERVSVDGHDTTVEDQTLVVVPLHPAFAPGRSFGPGDVDLMPVDPPPGFAGDDQEGNVRLLAGDSARFEAALPAGSGWKDLRLTITHRLAYSYSSTGHYVCLPGCAGSSPEVEAFNWTTGSWAALPVVPSWLKETADLGGAKDLISPSGVIELRLTANAGASAPIIGVALAGDA